MLEIKDLNVFYGAIHALKGISLTVDVLKPAGIMGKNVGEKV